jgi:iron(III) transport system substrate-binding protein
MTSLFSGKTRWAVLILLPLFAAAFVYMAEASPKPLYVYSSRKPHLIQPLLEKFTEATKIPVELVSDKEAMLISRLEQEGEGSPADVVLMSDVTHLGMAKEKQLLQLYRSDVINEVVPSAYRDPEGFWLGHTLRVRGLVYNPEKISDADLSDYGSLADDAWRGRVLVRSSKNVYNQSLVASRLAHHGEANTKEWVKGLVENFARTPQGGDTDQIRAVADGTGDIALVNSYYYGRLLASENADDKAMAERLAWFFPGQGENGMGAHVNISGGAIAAHSRQPRHALRLLEFLVSPEAQEYYAAMNHEYPVRTDVAVSPILQKLGDFKADDLALSTIPEYHQQAVMVMDEAGWR